jgi:hypothetical protein
METVNQQDAVAQPTVSTRKHRGRRLLASIMAVFALTGVVVAAGVSPAAAATYRCPAFVSWEDYGGARVHAYVDFHPSDVCNGRHVKRAYVSLTRTCGPYYYTGHIYTYTAGSTSDTRLYSVSAWIWDSALWSCNTNTNYGYDYF